jgi:hypothetical protein
MKMELPLRIPREMKQHIENLARTAYPERRDVVNEMEGILQNLIPLARLLPAPGLVAALRVATEEAGRFCRFVEGEG